jgi:hypothetical protein
MPNGRLDIQLGERSGTADTQHRLLSQTNLPAANIEDIGDGTIGGVVLSQIGVQQQQRHSAHMRHPDLGRHLTPRKRYTNYQLAPPCPLDGTQRQPREVVVRIGVLLEAVCIDGLSEIAVSIEEAYSDKGNPEVAGTLAVVTTEHSQPPRVDRQGLMVTVFHREIGHAFVSVVGKSTLKPGPLFGLHVTLEHPLDRAVGFHKGVVLDQ